MNGERNDEKSAINLKAMKEDGRMTLLREKTSKSISIFIFFIKVYACIASPMRPT